MRTQEDHLQSEQQDLAAHYRNENQLANKDLLSIGQAQCQELSTALYNRLPRELRDIFYGYLVEQSPRWKCMARVDKLGCSARLQIPSWCSLPHSCDHGICAYTHMDPRYMVAEAHREVIEAWLTRTLIRIAHDH